MSKPVRSKNKKTDAKYRRCAPLVVYWQDGTLVFENFGLQTRISADPIVCSILDFCSEWRTLPEFVSHLNAYSESSIAKTLRQLSDSRVLERSDAKRDPRSEAMESWAAWNPAAGFFHFSTKDTKFATDPRGSFEEFRRKTGWQPMPLPVKRYPKAPRTKLPRACAEGQFSTVLRERRTWRKFGREPVPLEALAQALESTFGIQRWVDVPGLGRAAIKTSPSGGCLHPIEAYVVAQHVEGLKSGVYHYNSARHEFERLRPAIPRKTLQSNLATQWWFTNAAFFVAMTAIFDRTMWKYDFPRSYRVVLAEAGHLCQTFCLAATWLGLAPFCTMAFTDTKWEEWLGIDGVKESILYVAGAGMKPERGQVRDANILNLSNGKR